MTRERKIAIAIYAVVLGAYLAASGGRLRSHSPDGDHYVWLANSWLHGRLDLGRPPPHQNDWAQVETVNLVDGRTLRGALVTGSTEMFRTLKGDIEQIPPASVKSREMKYYVSFPPFPAVLMLPFVAVWGTNTNDVLFTALLAPTAPMLLFLLLALLRRRGESARSERDDLWLTAMFAVGTVYFYSSVIGQVWYTAHVVSVICVCLYARWSIDARRPALAGLALVCGFLCRPEILFGGVFFVWELLRVHMRVSDDNVAPQKGIRAALQDQWSRLDKGKVLRALIAFGIPIAILGAVAAGLNYARFGRLTEFGHTYLNVRWTPRIQKFGLFNYAFLGRNLACLLALTPRLVKGSPWVQVSWHGLAFWITTPALLYLVWPTLKGRLHRPLWLTVACLAIPNLLYQNSGWVQFGYRFMLDYMVFLMLLLAVGGRRIGFWFKVLIIVGVAVNLFGALTFGRAQQFYFDSLFPPGID